MPLGRAAQATGVMPSVLGGLLLLVAALGAVAFPLATYTLTLACFGLAHVAVEVRYLDRRFAAVVDRRRWIALGVLLAGVFVVRVAATAGTLARPTMAWLELACCVAMVAVVLPALARRGSWRVGVGLAAAAVLLFGLLVSPAHALFVAAIVHNATPIGLVADGVPQRRRTAATTLAVLVFVAVPLLIAGGAPFAALRAFDLVAPEAALLPAGPLEDHLGAYLPRSLHGHMSAFHAFCAFTFMQCAHYAAVLWVLPRLQHPDARGSLPWPRPACFVASVATATALLFVFYHADFAEARAWYGTIAGVHACAELPALLLALAAVRPAGAARSRTTPHSRPRP